MRRALAVPTIASVLALAACGGGSESSAGAGGASAAQRAQDGALRFARCMREHGVDVPDPQVGGNGLVRIGPGPGRRGAERPAFDPENPRFREAEGACRKHLQGSGAAPDPAEQAEVRDAGVRYARCMRAEGVDVPDPGADGGVLLHRGAAGPDPGSAAFREADRKCHKHLAAIESRLGAPETSP